MPEDYILMAVARYSNLSVREVEDQPWAWINTAWAFYTLDLQYLRQSSPL